MAAPSRFEFQHDSPQIFAVLPAAIAAACDGCYTRSRRGVPSAPLGSEAAILYGRAVLYLVDASVFVFRAYYSVPIEIADPDGNPVNALHGFARFLGDLIEKQGPVHMAVAFDQGLSKSFRNEIYPAYKANREPAPAELRRQFALCREFCRVLGVAEFASPTLRGRRHHRNARDPRA